MVAAHCFSMESEKGTIGFQPVDSTVNQHHIRWEEKRWHAMDKDPFYATMGFSTLTL
jgi:hypothetical protein